MAAESLILDQRTAAILSLRSGRFTGTAWTLDETAAHFGLTRERVRYIEAKGLRAMERGGVIATFPVVKQDDGRWLPDPNVGRNTG